MTNDELAAFRLEAAYPTDHPNFGAGVTLGRWGDELGVFVSRAFPIGGRVLFFIGERIPLADLPVEYLPMSVEYAPGWYLGPSGFVEDYINHSCDPSCAMFLEGSQVTLRAVRPLRPGDQVTFDYATMMCRDPLVMSCQCGHPQCRGEVVRLENCDAATRRRLVRRGTVLPYVVEHLRARFREPRDTAAFERGEAARQRIIDAAGALGDADGLTEASPRSSVP